MTLELHPLCSLFPRMTGYDFECLKLDIKENGMRTPITTYKNMILDGGNRYLACMELGINPIFEKFVGDEIGTFVLTSNLHRRHLSPAQSAAIVASVQDWGKSQSHGGDRKSSATNSTCSDNVKTRSNQSGASINTQRKADAVAKASPELAAKVGRGEVSLNAATREVAPQLAPKVHVEPEIEVPQYEEFAPSDEEIAESIRHDEEQNSYIKKLLESDDPLAQAIKDVVRYKALARISEERFNGLQNEKIELIRMIKSLQNKLAKAAA